MLLCCTILALAACGDGPRQSVLDPAFAKRDKRALRIKVVKIYDNFSKDYCDSPRISQVVDVDVLEGPPELLGKSLSLPYDDFALGAPPPKEDEEVVMSPADWINQPATKKFRMREK